MMSIRQEAGSRFLWRMNSRTTVRIFFLLVPADRGNSQNVRLKEKVGPCSVRTHFQKWHSHLLWHSHLMWHGRPGHGLTENYLTVPESPRISTFPNLYIFGENYLTVPESLHFWCTVAIRANLRYIKSVMSGIIDLDMIIESMQSGTCTMGGPYRCRQKHRSKTK